MKILLAIDGFGHSEAAVEKAATMPLRGGQADASAGLSR